MSKERLKYYIGIGIMLAIGSLHILFFENNLRIDVYLLYNHKRYLTNILYDISTLTNVSILTYWLSKYSRKVFKPLFYTSIVSWFTYFLFYNQMVSLIQIPLYLCLIKLQKA